MEARARMRAQQQLREAEDLRQRDLERDPADIIFDALDINSDGEITRDEFLAGLTAFGKGS